MPLDQYLCDYGKRKGTIYFTSILDMTSCLDPAVGQDLGFLMVADHDWCHRSEQLSRRQQLMETRFVREIAEPNLDKILPKGPGIRNCARLELFRGVSASCSVRHRPYGWEERQERLNNRPLYECKKGYLV